MTQLKNELSTKEANQFIRDYNNKVKITRYSKLGNRAKNDIIQKSVNGLTSKTSQLKAELQKKRKEEADEIVKLKDRGVKAKAAAEKKTAANQKKKQAETVSAATQKSLMAQKNFTGKKTKPKRQMPSGLSSGRPVATATSLSNKEFQNSYNRPAQTSRKKRTPAGTGLLTF
jgi:hypothetical protein